MTAVPIDWDEMDDEPLEQESRRSVCSNWWNDVKKRVRAQNLRDLDGDWSIQDANYLYDTTLQTVRDALLRAGLTETQATDSINQMLNAGILFRERKR